ncbi:MAG: hypothetical protein QNJ54_28915 [Prochloraceae cyanobacterium]|nr:hypothetical protein [Prochloraceae cyanobacterium]
MQFDDSAVPINTLREIFAIGTVFSSYSFSACEFFPGVNFSCSAIEGGLRYAARGGRKALETVEGRSRLLKGDRIDFLLEVFRTQIKNKNLDWKATDKAGVYIGQNPQTS